MTETRSASIMRWLGALAVLAVGIDHIEQYYADYYRAVPTIGTLFVLDFIAALVVGFGLLSPLRHRAGRFEDLLITLLAIAGIAIGGGTLVGLLLSENGGLFGFMEVGYRGAIVLSMVFDIAAVVLLVAFLVLKRHTRWIAAVLSLGALVIAGCGGAGGYAASAPKAGGAPVNVVDNAKLGKIIVDGNGRTLYDFPIDKGTQSVCYGACASLWPPYLTKGAPKTLGGASAALVGTTKRRDGTTEVTYGGHPLYYYAPDRNRGQITGQALDQFGAPWYALTPSGREIHTKP